MFCQRCRKENVTEAHFCSNCGEPLQQMEAIPESYLVPAILVMLFCCQPLGIVAVIYAAVTLGKISQRDYAGARRSAKAAKNWCLAGFIGWLLLILLCVCIFLAGLIPTVLRGI